MVLLFFCRLLPASCGERMRASERVRVSFWAGICAGQGLTVSELSLSVGVGGLKERENSRDQTTRRREKGAGEGGGLVMGLCCCSCRSGC